MVRDPVDQRAAGAAERLQLGVASAHGRFAHGASIDPVIGQPSRGSAAN
jgi:hypothetical protein